MKEMSAHEQDYQITTLNMAAIAVIDQIKYSNGAIVRIVNFGLGLIGETLLIKKTVNEILFGYEDKLLSYLVPFGIVPSDIVGLFIGKNNTVDGVYTVNTGEDDYKNVGQVERYNYEP